MCDVVELTSFGVFNSARHLQGDGRTLFTERTSGFSLVLDIEIKGLDVC